MFNRAVVSKPGNGRNAKTPFGAHVVIHATAAETNGACGMWETFTPPSQGPAPHTHTRETEIFRVISGTYRFWCGDQEFDAPPGTVVALPPQVRHGWKNIGDTIGQMFVTVTRADSSNCSSILRRQAPIRRRRSHSSKRGLELSTKKRENWSQAAKFRGRLRLMCKSSPHRRGYLANAQSKNASTNLRRPSMNASATCLSGARSTSDVFALMISAKRA